MWDQLKQALDRTPAARYAAAAIAAMLVVGLRAALDPLLSPGPSYFLYYPAILLIAYRFGFGPSLVAVGVAAAAGYMVFSPPGWGVAHDVGEDVRLMLFAVTVSALAYGAARVSGRLRELEKSRLASPLTELRKGAA